MSKMHRIAVIEGDGVGPRVIRETLKAAGVMKKKYRLPIQWDTYPFSADYYLKEGITIPGTVFREWPEKYSAILLGALGDPRVKSNVHADEILMGLRLKLDLYVNFRPVKLINKKYCPLKSVTHENQVDFVVFRENTEDLYVNMGGSFKKDTDQETAVENSVHTCKGVERILRAAFAYAGKTGRSSVMMGDKSNVMKYAGDLWQRLFSRIGKEFPDVKKEHMYIDALCMEVIKNPSRFDVVVTSNMFGDILTDVAAQVQGGMGMAASVNYNPSYKKFLGLYEPVHGSAPDIAEKNTCNPMASILSFQLLLQHLGYAKEAAVVYGAVAKALEEGNVTPDLGGKCSTTEVGDLICSYIEDVK